MPPWGMSRKVKLVRLPAGWREDPPSGKLAEIGPTWAQGLVSTVLKAPSAIIPAESNYLLNPQHRDLETIVTPPPQPFAFDR